MPNNDTGPVVVKVGGSLYTMPDLGSRLQAWLAARRETRLVLVPGGGAAANTVRDLDRCHALGQEASHWLALRALSLNADFLATILRGAPAQVVRHPNECPLLWSRSIVPIVDPHAFATADDGQAGSLPHAWAVTSDSLAARVACVCGAAELILLKSVTIPRCLDWQQASAGGYVDEHFPLAAARVPLIRALNFCEPAFA